MNQGVQSPEQAARSLRVVRLVSFSASLVLISVVLIGIASLRYAPMWREGNAPLVAVVSEMRREPLPVSAAPSRPPPPLERRLQQTLEQRELAAEDLAPIPATPSEPVVITSPVWIERPRNPERFYPRDAFMQGIAGEVVLDCEVDVSGRLTCVVASETPTERGFGDAALRIASAHVMRPAMQNGNPVRGRYRMVVPFSPSG